MNLTACNDKVNILTTCPADTEQLLFFNVIGQSSGMALRSWSVVKNCLITSLFGDGIETINGTQLGGDNKYFNSDLVNNLVIFYNGINRFLIYSTEWEYILNGDNNVIGIQILIDATFGVDDIFLIFPNPTI